MPKTGLSVCLIAKNERLYIPDAIASVLALAQEIIVVDSGSSDETLPWLREQAHQSPSLKIFERAWPGSFADQRNFALAQATQDWILVLDADERLDPSDHDKILKALEGPFDAYELEIRNYTENFSELGYTIDATSPSPHGFVRTRLHRLFRRSPKISYEGILHERIEPSLLRHKMRVRPLDVVIHHFGKLKEQDLDQTQQRYSFYEDLGRRKLREHPFDAQSHWELGVILQKQHRLVEAEGEFLRALELAPNTEEYEVYFLLSLYQQKAWTRILHFSPQSARGKFFLPLARAEMDPEAIDEVLAFEDLYTQAPLLAFETALRKSYTHKIEKARTQALRRFRDQGLVDAIEGAHLRIQGRWSDAVIALETAFQKGTWSAFKDLSICLLKMNKPQRLLELSQTLPSDAKALRDRDVQKMLRLAELSHSKDSS